MSRSILSSPFERLASILDDARPPVLLTQERFQNRRPTRDARYMSRRRLEYFKCEQRQNLSSGVNNKRCVRDLHLRLDGQPKGVAITHEAISNRLLWMQHRFPLSPSDRVLQKTVYSFDASVWELFLPLMTGASVVMAAPGAQRDSAARGRDQRRVGDDLADGAVDARGVGRGTGHQRVPKFAPGV